MYANVNEECNSASHNTNECNHYPPHEGNVFISLRERTRKQREEGEKREGKGGTEKSQCDVKRRDN